MILSYACRWHVENVANNVQIQSFKGFNNKLRSNKLLFDNSINELLFKQHKLTFWLRVIFKSKFNFSNFWDNLENFQLKLSKHAARPTDCINRPFYAWEKTLFFQSRSKQVAELKSYLFHWANKTTNKVWVIPFPFFVFFFLWSYFFYPIF